MRALSYFLAVYLLYQLLTLDRTFAHRLFWFAMSVLFQDGDQIQFLAGRPRI
jgi:hypothetical protein